MIIVSAEHCRAMPWKNGGGSTTEIAVAPAGAALDAFDWRISTAQVGRDGPFSDFPGIDRTLAVIDGSGLSLVIGADACLVLGPESDPVSFAGDTPTSATLLAGAITDLNVMTRRHRFSHRLQRIRHAGAHDFQDDHIAVVLAFNGSVRVTSGRTAAIIDHGDAAILRRAEDGPFRLVPPIDGTASCYLAWLREHRSD